MAGASQNGKKGDILLQVNSLKKYFPIQKGLLRRVIGYVKAVDDVSLYVREGETLGLVGKAVAVRQQPAARSSGYMNQPPVKCCSGVASSPLTVSPEW